MTTGLIIGIVVCLLALGFLCYAAHVSKREEKMFEDERRKRIENEILKAELQAAHQADMRNGEMLFMQ